MKETQTLPKQKTVSAIKFIELWIKSKPTENIGEGVIIENINVNETIDINNYNGVLPKVKFKNVHFLVFRINECTFERITFQSSKVDYFSVSDFTGNNLFLDKTFSKTISLKNCIINDFSCFDIKVNDINIMGTSIIKLLKFDKICMGNLHIRDKLVEIGLIAVDYNSILGDINIANGITGNISISNSTTGVIRINGIQTGDISIVT